MQVYWWERIGANFIPILQLLIILTGTGNSPRFAILLLLSALGVLWGVSIILRDRVNSRRR